MMPATHLPRARVLEAISALGPEPWTVARLTDEPGESERRVRARTGGLMASRVIEPAGTETRATTNGKSYAVRTYRWTGRTHAPALIRNPGEAMRLRTAPTNLAMEWLSRAW